MLFNLSEIMSDPLQFLKSLLITLPGVLLALSIHECAHGWVAERCGDDTARLMGRITLNPLKHLDPIGFAMMFLAGFGWAKPVPVNPLKYKNYRSDDLKVSLAGITANLALFFVCFIITQSLFTFALAKLPVYNQSEDGVWSFYKVMNETESGDKAYRVIELDGEKYVMSYAAGWYGDELYKASSGLYYYKVPLISGTAVSGTAVVSGADAVIQPAFGKVVSGLYQMLCRCMLVNITLAVFNLIPLPPLDGYHVLNDLVLHQDLFAQKRTQQIASMVLIGLIMLGNVNPDWDIIGKILEFIQVNLIGSFTTITKLLAQSMGLV